MGEAQKGPGPKSLDRWVELMLVKPEASYEEVRKQITGEKLRIIDEATFDTQRDIVRHVAYNLCEHADYLRFTPTDEFRGLFEPPDDPVASPLNLMVSELVQTPGMSLRDLFDTLDYTFEILICEDLEELIPFKQTYNRALRMIAKNSRNWGIKYPPDVWEDMLAPNEDDTNTFGDKL